MRVLVQRRHAAPASNVQLPQLQGVWGAAGPPSGEREGRSPLAKLCSRVGARGAEPARILAIGAVRLRGRRQGAPAPCTPARGLRPFDPRFDAVALRESGAHAYGIDWSWQLWMQVLL